MQGMNDHSSKNNSWEAEKFLKAQFTERAVYGIVRVGGHWQQLKDGIANFTVDRALATKADLTDSQLVPGYHVYSWNTYVGKEAGMMTTSCAGVYEVQFYANDEATLKQMRKEFKAAVGFELRKKTYA